MKILERQIISSIREFINAKDVVVLHGARQVGKTSILKFLQDELIAQGKDTLYIDLEDLRFTELLNSGPQAFLGYLKERSLPGKGLLYVFIDEIQYLSNPSNFLKLMRDHHGDKIKLFVSGSSSFEIKAKFKESLVGRTVNFEIYPLSFREYIIFKGYKRDLKDEKLSSITLKELKDLYREYIIYGGYPRIAMENNLRKKEFYLQQIIDTYIRKDIKDLANIKDVLKFNKLLEILAAQSGNLLNIVELANTARLARQTVENYIFLMENTYILKLVPPFSSNLRAELFKTPKVFFCDTGIAHLLWLKTFPKTILGNMFETSVFTELIKQKRREELFFWRTQDRKEIDFIVRKGRDILPLEVKIAQGAFKGTAMKYFLEKYSLKKGRCICLDIAKRHSPPINFLYPWEI